MKTAYELAKKEVGVLEIAGEKDNPKIVQYFADVGHDWVKDDETAWCAAFVGAMLERSGVTSTKALNARSYQDWGVAVALNNAEPGDIVVFKRGDSAWQGHVGFYVSSTANHITVLGGNQSNQVSRAKYPIHKLIAIRRPSAQTNVTTVVKDNTASHTAIGIGITGAFAAFASWYEEIVTWIGGF